MESALVLLGTLGLLASVAILFDARRRIWHTSLVSVWLWSAMALFTWIAAWVTTVLVPSINREVADQLWYAASVLMLCPPIGVLGARRPGARVWPWFVLFPMLLVLGWPATTAWSRDFQLNPLQLEPPALIAFVLVLIMGAGNYLGTRFTVSVLLFCGTLILSLMPFTDVFSSPAADKTAYAVWATVCLSASIISAAWIARRRVAVPTPLDRLWLDFRDMFGIVWAKRAMDRANATFRNEELPVRIEIQGLVWAESELDATTKAETFQRIEQTLRWLLKRFVDPVWIDERLQIDRGDSK